MEITFTELRCKEVINVLDGKRLGKVCDLVFSASCCKVMGIVVPNERRLFRSKDDLYIPWQNIQKIGNDVILVQVALQSGTTPNCGKNNHPKPPCSEGTFGE